MKTTSELIELTLIACYCFNVSARTATDNNIVISLVIDYYYGCVSFNLNFIGSLNGSLSMDTVCTKSNYELHKDKIKIRACCVPTNANLSHNVVRHTEANQNNKPDPRLAAKL